MGSEMLSVLRDQALVTAGIVKNSIFSVNDTIVSEGMDDRRLYLIEKGRARVTGRVALASVIALDDVEALEFDVQALEGYLDAHPAQGYIVLKDVQKILTTRLRQTDRRWEQLFAWGLKEHGIDRHL